MRYSRMPPKKHGIRSKRAPAIIASVLVLGAVSVYLIGANAVADFFSENVVQPVAALFTGETAEEPATSPTQSEDPAASPTPVDDLHTQTLGVAPVTIYALQTGVFEQQENAESMALDAKNKGGAGYILEDEGMRVLLAAYETEQEANTVKQNLESSQEMQTALYEISSRELEFIVEGTSEEISAMQKAISDFETLHGDMYDLILAYDKGEKQESEVKLELAELKQRISGSKKTVDEMTNGVDNSIMNEFVTMLGRMEDNLASLELVAGIELSSGLKYAYIGFSVWRSDMVEAVSSTLQVG